MEERTIESACLVPARGPITGAITGPITEAITGSDQGVRDLDRTP